MAAVVAVVGSGLPEPERDGLAEAVGRGLAAAGATLVCGGLGGVMEAAGRGARAAGGRTVGILPGADRRAANPYVDVAIPTGIGEARNALVARAADALIAIAGEYGTLSEIAFALETGVPVVGLRTWDPGAPGGAAAEILHVADPAEAAREALRLARGQ
jgi:uncharacterized protein (TIGR00725 family)